jgi:hypothetical protein
MWQLHHVSTAFSNYMLQHDIQYRSCHTEPKLRISDVSPVQFRLQNWIYATMFYVGKTVLIGITVEKKG